MILVDSNVPMCLVGVPHPYKTDSQGILKRLISDRQKLVTDADVLQEILHRYVSSYRRDAIQPAFDALLGVVDQVFAIDEPTAQRAREIVLERPALSPRDALGHDGSARDRGYLERPHRF